MFRIVHAQGAIPNEAGPTHALGVITSITSNDLLQPHSTIQSSDSALEPIKQDLVLAIGVSPPACKEVNLMVRPVVYLGQWPRSPGIYSSVASIKQRTTTLLARALDSAPLCKMIIKHWDETSFPHFPCNLSIFTLLR